MKTKSTFSLRCNAVLTQWRGTILILSIAIFVSACTRSIPTPAVTIQFPGTPTAMPQNNQVISKTSAPETREILPQMQEGMPVILEIGHFDTELLIITIQFPSPIDPADYVVKIDGETYECIQQDEIEDRLYCFGPFISAQSAIVFIGHVQLQAENIEIELDLSAVQQ